MMTYNICKIGMVGDLTSLVRHYYCKDTNFLFINCSRLIAFHVHVTFLCGHHPACHINANRLKTVINLKTTDKYAAEYSKLHV